MSDKGSAAEAPVERLSTWDSLKVYGERRVFVMLISVMEGSWALAAA